MFVFGVILIRIFPHAYLMTLNMDMFYAVLYT